jgi:hypothetical protein
VEIKEFLMNTIKRGCSASLVVGLAWGCLVLWGESARGQDTASQKPVKPRDPYALPDPQRVFRLESESKLLERMARDGKVGLNPLNLKYDITLPDYPATRKAQASTRQWEPLRETVEPPFVCYRRLYFQQLNFERYGYDLGVLSPFLSTGAFCFDVLALPYHLGMDPFCRFECNTGYCLPGDHVPLLLYPPQWSASGVLGEAAAIGLLVVAFP